ncbi:hypothetical protein WJX72_001414 [[Myrmecia] bisecta]|uniref:UDP-N-acetylglucosamine pyrophosphorylase n=1 Tax=[Myrmecia] bisecta TaxID=41462 RepID=A0AAW1QPU9_9CHLO
MLVHVVHLAESLGCSQILVVVSLGTEPAVQEVLTAYRTGGGSLRQVVTTQYAEFCQDPSAVLSGLEALSSPETTALVLHANQPLMSKAGLKVLGSWAERGRDVACLTDDLQAPWPLCQHGMPVVCGPVHQLGKWAEWRKSAAAKEAAVTEAYPLEDDERGQLLEDTSNAPGWKTAFGGGVHEVDATSLLLVRSRADLAEAEKLLRQRLVAHHQRQGVTFRDPDNTWLGPDVSFGTDVEIGIGVQLMGTTHLGDNVVVEGPTVIKDSVVGANSRVAAFSHLDSATVGDDAGVGPFGRLRQNARTEANTYVGNFVELKNATLREGAQACHLAYLGDADVGAKTNIGAGTITCNFNGRSKNRTTVGQGAFIGSNSTLVAPVTVRDGAFVAAGSVITQEVPEGAVAFGRARQTNKEGYVEQLMDKLALQPTT